MIEKSVIFENDPNIQHDRLLEAEGNQHEM